MKFIPFYHRFPLESHSELLRLKKNFTVLSAYNHLLDIDQNFPLVPLIFFYFFFSWKYKFRNIGSFLLQNFGNLER